MIRSLLCALFAIVAAGLSHGAAANELTDAFQQVLRRPTDTEANLRYARLAEAAGQTRWALATYERILVNDPNNLEAQQGQQRMLRAIQPDTTLFTAEFGGIWESNPRQSLDDNRRGEAQAYGAIGMLDERNLGGVRWRTLGSALGIYHGREHDLNYGYVGLNTGPVIDLMPGLAMIPAIGGGAAAFDNRFFYGEGIASATFEGNLEGAYRGVRLRVGYRDYNDFFPTQHGLYADAVGKFTIPYVFGDALIILSPWARWSDLKGTAISPLTFIEVQPGTYTELGQRVEFNKPVADGVVLGVNVALSLRYYRDDLASDGTSKRRDTLIAPGAMLLMPSLFGFQTGLRVDYQYQWNSSNFDPRRYLDHIVTAAVVSRF